MISFTLSHKYPRQYQEWKHKHHESASRPLKITCVAQDQDGNTNTQEA